MIIFFVYVLYLKQLTLQVDINNSLLINLFYNYITCYYCNCVYFLIVETNTIDI